MSQTPDLPDDEPFRWPEIDTDIPGAVSGDPIADLAFAKMLEDAQVWSKQNLERMRREHQARAASTGDELDRGLIEIIEGETDSDQ